jgi:hypothetical protein
VGFFTKLLDVICFVIGPTILVASIFNFDFREATGDNSIAVAYIYGNDARASIAIAVALISFGILRRNWRKLG